MQLSLLTKDQVVANMAAAIQGAAAAGGFTISMAEGSPMLAMVEACAGIYLWLQWLVVQAILMARLATCSGADCDSFGADFGFVRLPGIAASGIVTFTRYSTNAAVYLPVGFIVKTTDGTQSFSVIADTTNPAWQAPSSNYPNGSFLIAAGVSTLSVSAQNLVAGTSGNVIAGAVGLIASTGGGVDTVTNPSAFTTGKNPEGDAAFKARFGLYLVSLARATVLAVTSAAMGVSQNITCAVLNCTATIGGAFEPGYAVVAVDDGTGATPTATLNAVADAAASDAMIPLGSVVSVVQAQVIWATVELTITCPTTALKSATQPVVQAAIANFIGSLAVATVVQSGEPPNNILPYTKLSELAYGASSNVVNVSAMTLNGGTADIGGVPGTVVRVQSITIN